jgi:aquaporin Z
MFGDNEKLQVRDVTDPSGRHQRSDVRTLPKHWPEYAMEAAGLSLFMVSAAGFATLLQHPASPVSRWTASPLVRRIPMGVAMGLTLIALVYSPIGRRSGAHMNPALTLTFMRLGKVAPLDAVGYVLGQFVGGLVGIVAATWIFRGLPAHPSVNYVATIPGPGGAAVALVAEAAISFGMMLLVLIVSNTRGLAHFTGVCAGMLVAAYITIEAPLSGMSMNPARSLGPAMLARAESTLWVYFTGPLTGMLLAAELYVLMKGHAGVECAKLHHPRNAPCIFKCGFTNRAEVSV